MRLLLPLRSWLHKNPPFSLNDPPEYRIFLCHGYACSKFRRNKYIGERTVTYVQGHLHCPHCPGFMDFDLDRHYREMHPEYGYRPYDRKRKRPEDGKDDLDKVEGGPSRDDLDKVDGGMSRDSLDPILPPKRGRRFGGYGRPCIRKLHSVPQ
jgi:hypothetical protein